MDAHFFLVLSGVEVMFISVEDVRYQILILSKPMHEFDPMARFFCVVGLSSTR